MRRFAAYLTEVDLREVAIDAGFAPEDVAIGAAPGGMYDGQKNYSTADFFWPVLIGSKGGVSRVTGTRPYSSRCEG